MIHQDQTKMTHDELLVMCLSLAAENDKLKAQGHSKLSFKVTVAKTNKDGTTSKGGAVSVYGLGRFPVTLYQGQWERLLGAKEEVLAFIEANKASLSVKE